MDKEGREILLEMTRRQFFGRTAKGIGVAALASLLGPEPDGGGTNGGSQDRGTGGNAELRAQGQARDLPPPIGRAHRKLSCLTTSPSSKICRARSCPTRSGRANALPA